MSFKEKPIQKQVNNSDSREFGKPDHKSILTDVEGKPGLDSSAMSAGLQNGVEAIPKKAEPIQMKAAVQTPEIQMKCEECEVEDKIQMKPAIQKAMAANPADEDESDAKDDIQLYPQHDNPSGLIKNNDGNSLVQLQIKDPTVQTKVELGAENTTETIEATETTEPLGLLVSDDQKPESHQLTKGKFLSLLETKVCDKINQLLEATGQSTDSCPYLKRIFVLLPNKSASQLEQTIYKYATAARSAKNANDYITHIITLLPAKVMSWLLQPSKDLIPTEFQHLVPDKDVDKAKQSKQPVQAKEQAGETVQPKSPQKVQEELGKGSSFSGDTKGRMETAFGSGFSNVQIHTDSKAQQLSGEMKARAFTVGNHIAFGAGEYKPNTLVGDALLAHELAHVEQQRGADVQTQSKPQMSGMEYNALESEANEAATQVMQETYGGKEKGLWKRIKATGGLSLQRCPPEFEDLTPAEQKTFRDEVLAGTSVTLNPDPGKGDVYAGTSYGVSLDAPRFIFSGAREFPSIRTLVYEFPDGTIMRRRVHPKGNIFMPIGTGLHKIKATVNLVPGMVPAKFERSINVKSLRELTDPIAQEDITKSNRGKDLFSELYAVEEQALKIRVDALKTGLPKTLLDSWAAANSEVISLEGLLSTNTTPDAATITKFQNAVGKFYTDFRTEIKGRDYKDTIDVYLGEGQSRNMEVTKNPFLSEVGLNGKLSVLRSSRVGTGVKVSSFLYATKTFDSYIRELLEKGGKKESADQLAGLTTQSTSLRGIYRKHGNIQALKAVFYPAEQSQLEGGVGKGLGIPDDYRAKKYDLRFYTYKTVKDNKYTWHLVDATNPVKTKETDEEGGTATSPPDELFKELDNASRFPLGILYWQMPGQSLKSHDIKHPLTWSQFLTYLGIGLAIIGITLATGGAGTAATVFFVGSGIAGAAGAIADIAEKSELGVLTAKDIALNTLTIASSLLSAGTVAAGRVVALGAGSTGRFARLAVGVDKFYKPLAGLTLGTDLISLAVFTIDFGVQLTTIINSKTLTGEAKKQALQRLVLQGLLMGGLSIMAVNGSMADFRTGRSLYLDLNPAGPKARLILPEDKLLGSALVGTKKADLEGVLKSLDTPTTQTELFQVRAEISAAIDSGHVKAGEISKYIDDIKAAKGDKAKLKKLTDDFRAKNLETVKYEAFRVEAKKAGLKDAQAQISIDAGKAASKGNPKQSIDTSKTIDEQLDELYAQAKIADAELKTFANGVGNSTNGSASFRPASTNGGLKGKPRAKEKIEKDYKNDATQLIDISGAQITFNSLDDLYAAVKKISGSGKVVKYKDNIVKPYKSGYGDIKLSLKMSNGHVVELKLLPASVKGISDVEHALYEKVRKGVKLNATEQAQFDQFSAQYKAAWEKLFNTNN